MRLSEKISVLLFQRSLNQESLADALDLSQATVSRWISGVRPHRSTAQKIAAYFEIPVEILLDDDAELPEELLQEPPKAVEEKPPGYHRRSNYTPEEIEKFGDKTMAEITDEEMDLWFDNHPEEAEAIIRNIEKSYNKMKKSLEDFENMVAQLKESTKRYNTILKKNRKRPKRRRA